MTERAPGTVDADLQQDAAMRLLEWGFSCSDIASNLGHSEAWVRAAQAAEPAARSSGSPETPSSGSHRHTEIEE